MLTNMDPKGPWYPLYANILIKSLKKTRLRINGPPSATALSETIDLDQEEPADDFEEYRADIRDEDGNSEEEDAQSRNDEHGKDDDFDPKAVGHNSKEHNGIPEAQEGTLVKSTQESGEKVSSGTLELLEGELNPRSSQQSC